jgi:hypothetical protein
MSLKYLMILVLASAATAACASVPQSQVDTGPSAGATCEVKSDRKVASCGNDPSPDNSVKVSEEPASRPVSAREPFHHRGRMGD